jgi:hypothetical protein
MGPNPELSFEVMLAGGEPLAYMVLAGGPDTSFDPTNGTLSATYPPMALPATVELPPEMQFDLPRRRVPLDRQEFGNEMAAAVFGLSVSATVWHTTGAALLGGVAGWLGYRHISRRDRR